VAKAQIVAPLFIVGLPRTGTSFLHTLLSHDTDNFLSPLNWMVVDPTPPLFGTIDQDEHDSVPGDSAEVAATRKAWCAFQADVCTRGALAMNSVTPCCMD
jgi:hypothetical protein